MFKGIKLNNLKVLEAMCGSGQTTNYLLSQGADTVCLDVSQKALNLLRSKFPQVNTIHSSMIKTGLKDKSIDCVVVVGGLHHVHPEIIQVMDEIYRILKPDGYLCFFEPHQGSLVDGFRSVSLLFLNLLGSIFINFNYL